MKIILLAIFAGTAAGFAAGCSGGGATASAPCNPVGFWQVEITYGSGTCGFTGIAEDDLTVTATTAGTSVFDATGRLVPSTITTSGDSCLLSATETGKFNNGDSYTENRRYTLLKTAITGSGSIIDTTTSCTQQFAINTGTFTPG